MKKILTMFAIAGVAASLHADLLYWQVTSSDVEDISGASDYAYAKIYQTTDGGANKTELGTTYVFADGSESIAKGTYGYDKLDVAEGVYSALGYVYPSSPAAQFAIELFDSSGNVLANSGWSTGDMSAYISKTEFGSNWSAMTATSGFGTSGSGASWTSGAVPEPTSGLMLLVGMAMLGLRRRKVA